jgi:GT2 family glycosyltransferase
MSAESINAARSRPTRAAFRPVRIKEVELTAPLAAISTEGPVRLLVRRARRPVGFIEVTVPPGGWTADEVSRAVTDAVGDQPADACGPDPDVGSLPPATVVVTTCLATEALLSTLRCLQRQTLPPAEIVVVDNRPETSGVAALLRSANLPGVVVVREPRPGLSRARIAGLARARGEIVAFTDDDVVIDEGWLEALVRGFADDSVACVTGLVLPFELQTPAQAWFEEFGGYAKGYASRRFDLAEHRAPGRLYPFAAGLFGTGANGAFRRSVLRELGGFDDQLGLGTPARGGEDLDAYLTVVQAGLALVYEPAAVMWHRHCPEMRALRKQIFGYGLGLSAMIAKRWAAHPHERRQILVRAVAAAYHLVSPRSPKNQHKGRSYPVTLTLLEWAGLAVGPFAYALSRARNRPSS